MGSHGQDARATPGMSAKSGPRRKGISGATDYNWRKQYGQMDVNQAMRLKALQKETIQLKKLVADLSLDNAILKETLSGNF
jgi:hypothetical protein